jgi:hypothetical protein
MDGLIDLAGLAVVTLVAFLIQLLIGLVSLEGLFRLAFQKPRVRDP